MASGFCKRLLNLEKFRLKKLQQKGRKIQLIFEKRTVVLKNILRVIFLSNIKCKILVKIDESVKNVKNVRNAKILFYKEQFYENRHPRRDTAG
jgi:hypothetical protein